MVVDLIVALGLPVWLGVEEVLRYRDDAMRRDQRITSGADDEQPTPSPRLREAMARATSRPT